jgi:hypothetical protein
MNKAIVWSTQSEGRGQQRERREKEAEKEKNKDLPKQEGAVPETAGNQSMEASSTTLSSRGL